MQISPLSAMATVASGCVLRHHSRVWHSRRYKVHVNFKSAKGVFTLILTIPRVKKRCVRVILDGLVSPTRDLFQGGPPAGETLKMGRRKETRSYLSRTVGQNRKKNTEKLAILLFTVPRAR